METMTKLERMARAIATMYGDPDEIATVSRKPLWKLYLEEAEQILSAYEASEQKPKGAK